LEIVKMNKNAIFGLGGFIVGIGLTMALSGGGDSNMAGQAIGGGNSGGDSSIATAQLISDLDFANMNDKQAGSLVDCLLDCEDDRQECVDEAVDRGSDCHQHCLENDDSIGCHAECSTMVAVDKLGCDSVFAACAFGCANPFSSAEKMQAR
jgi:hypothetical protein